MAYCPNCGTEMNNNVCSRCGYIKRVGNENEGQKKVYCPNCGMEINNNMCARCGYIKRAENDNGGFGWGLLGFCIPIVGLVLYLVWNSEKPKTARAAGMGAVFYVVFLILLYISVGCAAAFSM